MSQLPEAKCTKGSIVLKDGGGAFDFEEGKSLKDVLGPTAKIYHDGEELKTLNLPNCLKTGRILTVGDKQYRVQFEETWRPERCTTGFVHVLAWDFDPTQPAVRGQRSYETKHGFPFDIAYFGVWRDDKAKQFLAEITSKGSAIFRAPPYSGKTSMMQCIAIIASRSQDRKVFPLSFLGFQSFHELNKANLSLAEIFEQFWLQQSGYTYSDWKARAGVNGAILLLDEIQVLYEYELEKIFWSMIREWETRGVVVIAAAVYTVAIVTAALSGHVQWGKEYYIGDLRLTNNELDTLCSRFNKCNRVSEDLLSTHTAEWIRDNTAGHIGFTRELLDGLEEYANMTSLHGDQAAARYLASSKPFDAIKNCRGYPLPREWTGNMREACAIMLTHAPIGSFADMASLLSAIPEYKDKAVYPLLKLGVLSLVDASTVDFSSPVMHYLCAKELAIETQIANISDIDSLVVEIVRRLQPEVLQKAFNVPTMCDNRLGEPIWRAELYRAALACLGNGHSIMPEVGHIVHAQDGTTTKIPGLVDFFVNGGYSWALEVMREGYGISEHLGRFAMGGMYANLPVNDFRVIDFRSQSKKASTTDPHLLTISYNKDFTNFTISGGNLASPQTINCDVNNVVKLEARTSWWTVLPGWWR